MLNFDPYDVVYCRKHTGEKPFKCIVPGCERMFSRFDNMMQHTQTHNKGKASRRSKQSVGKSGKGQQRRSSDQSSYVDSSMPSPPPSRRSSIQKDLYAAGRNRFSDDEDDDDFEDGDSDASYQPPSKRHNPKEQRDMMAELRRLSQEQAYHHYYQHPPPPWWSSNTTAPPSPTAVSTSSADSIGSYHQRRRSSNRVTPAVHFHPYPSNRYHPNYNYNNQLPRRHSEDFMTGRMILPSIASYLVKNPDEPPENYLLHHEKSASPPTSPKKVTRRLSVQDLCNPIESLEPSNMPMPKPEEQSVDLTEDEFQALQGLGRFRLVALSDSKQ